MDNKNFADSIEQKIHDYLKDNLRIETSTESDRLCMGCWVDRIVTTVYLGNEKIAESSMTMKNNRRVGLQCGGPL
jgi:hypothetical protein